jgi:hypothetical protein
MLQRKRAVRKPLSTKQGAESNHLQVHGTAKPAIYYKTQKYSYQGKSLWHIASSA